MAKLPITQTSTATDNIQSLPNQVKGQAAAVKLAHDQYGIDNNTYVNNTLIPELNGNDGSKKIGHSSASVTADNVNEAIEENRQSINGVVLGQIPDGSLTKAKLDASLSAEVDQGVEANTKATQNTKGVAILTGHVDELATVAGVQSKAVYTTGVYYDYLNTQGNYSIGSIDFGKAFASVVTQTNTVAITSLIRAKDGTAPIDLADCFEVGEVVEVYNDTSSEYVTITAIDDGTDELTVNPPISGTYAAGANVARSDLDPDTFKPEGFNGVGTKDLTTPVQITTNGTPQAVVELKGEMYSAVLVAGVGLKIFTSDGTEHARIDDVNITLAKGAKDIANDKVQFACNDGSTGAYVVIMDENSSGDLYSTRTSAITGQTEINNVGLDINGTKLGVGVNSKNSGEPTYTNIVTREFTIQPGGGSIVADYAQEQMSNDTGGGNWGGLTLAYDGVILTLSIRFPANEYLYYGRRDNTLPPSSIWDSNWTVKTLTGYTHDLNSAKLYEKANGSNVGRIFIGYTFGGTVRVIYSDDAGQNWSSEIDLGTGSNPQLSENANGDIAVVYENSGNVVKRTIADGTTTPDTLVILITSATSPKVLDKAYDYENVIVLAEKATPEVVLYGKWTSDNVIVPRLTWDVVVRLNNILKPAYISDSFIQVSDITGVDIDQYISFTDTGVAESYVTADKNGSYPTPDANFEEWYFDYTNASPKERIAIRSSMSRLSTSDDVTVKAVLGGVS